MVTLSDAVAFGTPEDCPRSAELTARPQPAAITKTLMSLS
jgi:hypothetical protein